MTDYHCENCEFFEDRSTDKLIDGYCKKYNCPLNFYDWWEKCDKCIIDTLKAENAALRDRLERAVELPFVPSDHHIEMWAAEIKESCADLSAKIVIPCYLYIKCEDKDTAVERLNELCQYTDN